MQWQLNQQKPEQTDSCKTMTVIRENVSSKDKDITRVKNALHGGIIIECNSKNASEVLKTDVESKLGGDYNVTIPAKRRPKLRVFGMSKKYTADELKNYLRTQNAELFLEESSIDIVEIFQGAKGRKVWI